MGNNNDTSKAKIFTSLDQLTAELNQQEQSALGKCYTELRNGLKNINNHSSITEIFRLSDKPEWPLPYYQMRDTIWTKVFGIGGTYLLINYLLNGKPPFDIGIIEEDSIVLEKWFILYKNAARRAEDFSSNPMGFEDFYTAYNTNTCSYMIRPFRNDGSYLNLLVEPENVEFMILRLLEILPEIEGTYGRKIDRTNISKRMDSIR